MKRRFEPSAAFVTCTGCDTFVMSVYFNWGHCTVARAGIVRMCQARTREISNLGDSAICRHFFHASAAR